MKYFAIVLLNCIFPVCIACDMCNCYLPINPAFNKNLIGVRLRYTGSEGIHEHSETTSGGMHSHGGGNMKESFYTFDLWGRLYIRSKWQLLFNLPFSSNVEKMNNTVSQSVNGIGDLSVISSFQLYNTIPYDSTGFRQRLFAGGGVKLPTGMYERKNTAGELNEHLQPGTGSFDLIGMISYMAKFNKTGITMDVTYRNSSLNSNSYKFGNRLNIISNVFYTIKAGTVSVLPSVGVVYEYGQYDIEQSVYMKNTGGDIALGSIGCDVYFKRISLNTAYNLPLFEQRNGEQGLSKSRIIIGINYSFN